MTDPFTPDDLQRYREITELHCAASVASAACTVKTVDASADRYRSAIWCCSADGGAPKQLTSGVALDNTPRWSPDGLRMAFLSDQGEDGLRQIYVMPAGGGDARQLSHLPSGIMAIEWSPTGRELLAIGIVNVDSEARGKRRTNSNPDANAPQIAWRLPYKSDGLGFTLGRELHLFVVDAVNEKHRQLTDGPFDVRSAAWSPNGEKIVFTRTREGRTAHRTDVWTIDVDGRNARQLTDQIASVQSPKWSPDGRWIAFSGSKAEGDAQVRLWLFDVRRGVGFPLGGDDIEAASGDALHWAEDSASLLFILVDRGRRRVVRIQIRDGRMTHIVAGDRHILKLAAIADRIFFTGEGATTPNEVATVTSDGSNETVISNFNEWWRERLPFSAAMRIFDVPDERGGTEQIEGWLLTPADAQGPTPLLVDVHGGPASYVLLAYRSHPWWPVLCSHGWSILALNPVGSSSYGRAFAARLRANWGVADLCQQVGAVKQLQAEGIVDERVAIAGKSYGGYLSAWAIGHSDLFRAAVVLAPVADLESHYGSSDSGYYADPYSLNAEPEDDRARTRELSPVTHIGDAKAPTLFLQGEDDQRCPIAQSEQLFVALMRNSAAPTEMVIYPGGSHHFLESGKPSHRVDAVTRLVDWVEHWVEPPTNMESSRSAAAEQLAIG